MHGNEFSEKVSPRASLSPALESSTHTRFISQSRLQQLQCDVVPVVPRQIPSGFAAAVNAHGIYTGVWGEQVTASGVQAAWQKVDELTLHKNGKRIVSAHVHAEMQCGPLGGGAA